MQDPLNAPLLMFIGFPSAKDPDFERRLPGKSTAVIITEGRCVDGAPSLVLPVVLAHTPHCSFEQFEQFAGSKQGQRGNGYAQLKDAIGQRLLDGLLDMFPHLADRVEVTMYATPLTNQFYLGSPHGESYGLAPHMDRSALCMRVCLCVCVSVCARAHLLTVPRGPRAASTATPSSSLASAAASRACT